MIRELKLNNFMRHENLVLQFSDGMQLIRAANEGGKSTLLRAIAYALYGSRVLPAALSEVVTWGHSENTLKVELTLSTGHTFVRGKTGAEVRLNGEVHVTGQNEVSAFAAELIGVDAGVASLLMFANQGALRGALDQGPKATGELLEALADLDIFERILERAQERLALGSPALYDERLKGLRAQEALLPAMPIEPDEAAHTAALVTLGAKIAKHRADALTLQPEIEATTKLRDEEAAKVEKADVLVTRFNTAKAETERHRATLAAIVVPEDQSNVIASLRARVAEEAEAADRAVAYKTFESHTSITPLAMTLDQATAEANSATYELSEMKTRLTEIKGEENTAKAQVVTGSVCPTCGNDVSKSPQVVERNAALAVKLAALETERITLEQSISLQILKVQTYEVAIREQNRQSRLFGSMTRFLTIDESVIPNRVEWKGSVPGDNSDSKPQLAAAEALQAERGKALGQKEMLIKMIEKGMSDMIALQDEAAGIGADPAKLEALRVKWNDLVVKQSQFSGEAYVLEQERNTSVDVFTKAKADYANVKATRDRIIGDIVRVEAELSQLAFNNALVKKVRSARPIVTTKLWNLVLTSVSTLFTQLRGEKSVVTRGEKGFLVNGQAIETLSGSTLDILAVAIRVALVRTFIPQCQFIALDEPAAAMDSSRTESLLGFLASLGFSQMLLITHEEVSASVCDNVIWLE